MKTNVDQNNIIYSNKPIFGDNIKFQIEKYQNDYKLDNNEIDDILALHEVKNSHCIWTNPLLLACERGELSIDEYKFLFSQYYLYSKNFTKLISAGMVNCDSDYYRSKLSENLWEEGGGEDIELRHAEIFRKFLTDSLNIDLNLIKFEDYTENFCNKYLDLCLRANSTECAAILSFGTEAIVGRLYSVIKKGLMGVGISEEALNFFNIHIACDDDHALTLEEMVISYRHEERWFKRCKDAINKALDLRHAFFLNIYRTISFNKVNKLLEKITISRVDKNNARNLKSNIRESVKPLYENDDIQNNINFKVDRLDVNPDVLDPRLVTIPSGSNNELHSHAHETIFLILEGDGKVTIDGDSFKVMAGDIVYVPRWSKHQTHNTGNKTLKFFAVTDYGFTRLIPQNTESVYRLKK